MVLVPAVVQFQAGGPARIVPVAGILAIVGQAGPGAQGMARFGTGRRGPGSDQPVVRGLHLARGQRQLNTVRAMVEDVAGKLACGLQDPGCTGPAQREGHGAPGTLDLA